MILLFIAETQPVSQSVMNFILALSNTAPQQIALTTVLALQAHLHGIVRLQQIVHRHLDNTAMLAIHYVSRLLLLMSKVTWSQQLQSPSLHL